MNVQFRKFGMHHTTKTGQIEIRMQSCQLQYGNDTNIDLQGCLEMEITQVSQSGADEAKSEAKTAAVGSLY